MTTPLTEAETADLTRLWEQATSLADERIDRYYGVTHHWPMDWSLESDGDLTGRWVDNCGDRDSTCIPLSALRLDEDAFNALCEQRHQAETARKAAAATRQREEAEARDRATYERLAARFGTEP